MAFAQQSYVLKRNLLLKLFFFRCVLLLRYCITVRLKLCTQQQQRVLTSYVLNSSAQDLLLALLHNVLHCYHLKSQLHSSGLCYRYK
jgi:hypothetical protein